MTVTDTDVWAELELPDKIGDDLRAMVRLYEDAAARNKQIALGPSQIGNPCTRCLARRVLGIPVERAFTDPWCRIIGTAVHAWLDEAAAHHNTATNHARFIPELRVQPDPVLLPDGGKCDLFDTATNTVIDHKVVGPKPLTKYRSMGPGDAYRAQVHLYGLGYTAAGYHVDNVAIAFWMRGGRLIDLYVWAEPFDPAIAYAALDRYRTIRDQALTIGPAIIPLLPADPDCWDCGGMETPTTQPNPTQPK
jgi:hypothetical protein